MFYDNNMCIYLNAKDMTSKKLNKYKNAIEFQNVFSALANEALYGRYGIEGIPKTCNERVIMQSLLWYGSVTFFKKAGSIFSLPGLPDGNFTLYGNPVNGITFARNGKTERVKYYIPNYYDNAELVLTTTSGSEKDDGEAVYVRENELVYPFINYVVEFADKIADTYRTLDITRANIKRPYVVTAEESVIEGVKAFFNNRANNESYIISSGIFPADKINLLPFENNPENIRDCTGLIDFYYSKFRELESISSSPATIDKKAQISVPELNQNVGAEKAINESIRSVLQRELDFCNEKLGTNMRVVSKMAERSDNNDPGSEQHEDNEGVRNSES